MGNLEIAIDLLVLIITWIRILDARKGTRHSVKVSDPGTEKRMEKKTNG